MEERPPPQESEAYCLSSSVSEVLPQQQPQLRPARHASSTGAHRNLSVAGSVEAVARAHRRDAVAGH